MTMKADVTMKGSLYGLSHSNRSQEELWGKNQFNSTFPAALACYMKDEKLPAVYLTLGGDLQISISDLSIENLFNTELPNSELQFDFETPFHPYQQYALGGSVGGIDLVIRQYNNEESAGWLRPLEVKLTVIPDNTSSERLEADWSAELVIRPTTTKYCALGIYHSCKEHKKDIRDIFRNVCGTFKHWDSPYEVAEKREPLLNALNIFQKEFCSYQQPFLMQPIWKTAGKSPSLADDAFDIFVWSDFALCRSFTEALESGDAIDRRTRAAARLARTLYVLSTQGEADLNQIYTEMAYGLLTDKEFALSAQMTRDYFNTPRRLKPILPKEVVAKIILNGGERLLSPERRFDATIFFTAQTLFEVQQVEVKAVEAVVEILNDKASIS